MYRIFGQKSLSSQDLISESRMTLYSQKLKKYHKIRLLKNYTKVIIYILRENWTSEQFITEYDRKNKVVIIRHYKFKLLDNRVKDTTSLTLKMFREEQVCDYYKEYLLQEPVIVRSL